MIIKRKIKKLLKSSIKGTIFINRIRIIREKIELLESDEQYIRKTFKKRFNKEINLNNPTTFQEKLQWLKLFYRSDVMPICSDKARLHEYLESKNLSYLSNEILGVFDDANDIEFDSLPNKFVAKANHGSGWNLICEDKNELNWNDCKKLMNSWLDLNLYVFGREWNYKNIEPKIVIEKYIDYKPLNDYKYMCFNGEPLYIQLNNDYNGVHYVDFYEIENWKHLDCTYGPYIYSKNRIIEKPNKHDEMMRIARILSKDFPFVRVDFYNYEDEIIVGELTFFPGGGLWSLNNENSDVDYDLILGEKLVLPKANYPTIAGGVI